MDARLFAFWRYDSYPYYLGGEINKMDENGRVQTIEYGPGTYFRPVKILPYEAGVALKKRLKDLEMDYNKARRELEYVFKDKLNGVFHE